MRHRTPSNSASPKLARRVHERSLVRRPVEQVEASGVPEKAAGILPKRPEPASCRRRLLLAEDDVETRRLLGAALRRQGFEVVEACDGAELLDHISAAANAHRLAAGGIAVRSGGAYDAVIADNQLPVLCGLDVLAAPSVRALPRALHPDHGVRR